MSFRLSRRTMIVSAASLPVLAACSSSEDELPAPPENEGRIEGVHTAIAYMESQNGGPFGVSAVNLATGQTITHRGDERFAMCSSFKWLLAALVLQRVQAGEEDLSRMIEFSEADMVMHAPITEPALGEGRLSVEALCRGTVQTSDNPAANLLLRTLGGPEGFTQILRDNGEMTTRLDRWEPMLNENAPGDPQDTSTPNAMVSLMGYYLFGGGLNAEYQTLLKDWMIGATTGLARLRDGMDAPWIGGDKTGTSSNNQSNDVAFAYRPDAPNDPILITSYLNVENPVGAETDELHATIGRQIMWALA